MTVHPDVHRSVVAPGVTSPRSRAPGAQTLSSAHVDLARHGGSGDNLAHDAASGEDETTLLHRVCGVLVGALPVAAVAVTLVDERGDPLVTAAEPQALRAAVVAQWERGAGPSVDACRTGEAVVETDGTEAAVSHWGGDRGWRAVQTLAVRSHGRTVGVVTLASLQPGGFAAAETDAARGIIAIAAAHASTMRALRGSRELAAHLQEALNSRIETEQATGIVAQQLDVSLPDALEIMRSNADGDGRLLAEVAHDVVAGRWRRGGQGAQDAVKLKEADTSGALDGPAVGTQAPPTPAGPGSSEHLLSIIATDTPGRVRLVGEADISAGDLLARTLARLVEEQGDITLDLGDLKFLDCSSIGVLVGVAAGLAPLRTVVLLNATGIVARILSVLDIGKHPRIWIA